MSLLEKLFGKTPGVFGQRGFRHEEEEGEEIMKLVAGLGNPGDKYAGTRHNIGFAVIEELAGRHNIRLTPGKQRGRCGSGMIGGVKVMLVQPQTFMNESGACVGPMLSYYNLTAEDLIVVYDDIALDTGRLRIRKAGSAGGHNGMKSIISHVGTQEFVRVRVGAGKTPEEGNVVNHVLGHFSAEELPVIREAVSRAADAVEMMLSDGVDIAMNRFNG